MSQYILNIDRPVSVLLSTILTIFRANGNFWYI